VTGNVLPGIIVVLVSATFSAVLALTIVGVAEASAEATTSLLSPTDDVSVVRETPDRTKDGSATLYAKAGTGDASESFLRNRLKRDSDAMAR